MTDDPALGQALAAFGVKAARVAPLGRGLINETFEIEDAMGRWVLQRVNPIFDPSIHENIVAVTERLAEAGMETPRLRRTTGGRCWADLGGSGVWRMMTFVEGVSLDACPDVFHAEAAGRLVGRFHRALERLDHPFAGMRLGVHDTARHLATLREAVERHRAHRLHGEVAPLANEILAASESLDALPEIPLRVGHGDLKFNNVMFAERGARDPIATCLVDLDTVGPVHLAHELGDAWRSWCNPHGEDRTDAAFDLDCFAASLEGYRRGREATLSAPERAALLWGPEWISLELAARFAADALRESYFGFDRASFERPGEHNLLRARGQWSLFREIAACRDDRARLLDA